MRVQDIVNNWDYPSKIYRHCHKSLVPKIVVRHNQREMFVNMSLPDRLDCLVDFVGMILLCLLPLPNCFFRVCFPTLFAADLKDFLPLISSLPSLVQQNPTCLHLWFLQRGRQIYAKMELLFS